MQKIRVGYFFADTGKTTAWKKTRTMIGETTMQWCKKNSEKFMAKSKLNLSLFLSLYYLTPFAFKTNGAHNNLFTYAPAFSTPNEEITEILLGCTGNDLISGSYDADYIDGGDDNDVLYGNSGNDFMFGGQWANDKEWRAVA